MLVNSVAASAIGSVIVPGSGAGEDVGAGAGSDEQDARTRVARKVAITANRRILSLHVEFFRYAEIQCLIIAIESSRVRVPASLWTHLRVLSICVYIHLFVPKSYKLDNILSSSHIGEVKVAEEKKSTNDLQRIFMTFQEAQEFLGVSHQTLYKLMSQGLLSHKIGKKRVFLREELIQWIKEH